MHRGQRIQPQHGQQLEIGDLVELQAHDDNIRLERGDRRVRLVVRVDELDVVGAAVQHGFDDGKGISSPADENGELPATVTGHKVGRHIGLAHTSFKKRATFRQGPRQVRLSRCGVEAPLWHAWMSHPKPVSVRRRAPCGSGERQNTCANY